MNLFEELGDMFRKQNELYTKQRELEAIWLKEPVVTGYGTQRRIATGDPVRIENGKLVNCEEGKPATHKIIMCMGTMYSDFELTVMDMQTNEPLNIKLQ